MRDGVRICFIVPRNSHPLSIVSSAYAECRDAQIHRIHLQVGRHVVCQVILILILELCALGRVFTFFNSECIVRM